MNYWAQDKTNVFVAAHRGWKDKYPENTLQAFQKAIELGVDQIETDVRMTSDGQLVLIHDSTVDRTTNGSGAVCQMSFDQIRSLDAGNGNKIPTLIEFMELIKDHPTLTIDLELKVYPTEGFEDVAHYVCDKVIEIIEQYNFADRCVFNSFSGPLLQYVINKYGGKYKTHTYFPAPGRDPSEFVPQAYCGCVFGLIEGKVTADEINEISKKTGVRIWAGAYAKDEDSINKCVEMGAELITCNNPDEVLAILRKKNLHK